MYRVGIGYDTHRLVKGRKLVLGGVRLPSAVGLLGHSDADVLVHALCDALLGACGRGDIGEHFPDSHPKYKDISSLKLLIEVYAILKKRGYSINNVDTVIVAQRPQLTRYKPQMRKKIAHTLNLALNKVNLKATTTEGLGPEGRGKAISAYAIALIKKC
ncbi:MAG: 2-C-methyl-D-erythritol 2,4-cyclodiphosphate synthase [Candidatus Omnitrophica bacterium]|nr:2-C-methyl-D-erythritol 2,4-cyclodiphosphate synthase [Candidatus Omnitrophota bacterium]